MLRRVIHEVDPSQLGAAVSDPWLYFYEDFLAEYDPRLRKDRGVYYTPAQVVQAQVKLIGQLLEQRFSKQLTFADDDVVLLDPGTGTGTYPLAALAHGIQQVSSKYGEGAVAGRASVMAQNMHAFEILVGPYAVAHLRITQQLLKAGAVLPSDGVHVYLTDTLESPYAEPDFVVTLRTRRLSDEYRRAQEVKANTRVLVCLGNPPYDRQQAESADAPVSPKGAWVRFGDETRPEPPILDGFLNPARDAGAGVHLKNLYNDYVYFWRWALWKVFDQPNGPGIVSFITASSYLRGPGFIGMREVMRRTFDQFWIIDLEGDNLGARKTENVFAIRNPVAIAVGVRYGEPQPETPADVNYTKIVGTEAEKLAALERVSNFDDLEWQSCPTGWHDPFLPIGAGNYFRWPLLTDLFPWQHSGMQLKRTWPIAPDPDTLRHRWRALLERPSSARAAAFRETGDRRVTGQYRSLESQGALLQRISELSVESAPPEPIRYGFRSFDRQWVLSDVRLADRIRPPLWHVNGPNQVFMTSLLTGVLGEGPAATVTAYVPDLHHFRGSFGGKDIIPLWRDQNASVPNVTHGLLELLSNHLNCEISIEDLFAYCYMVLSSTDYTARFSEELAIPGPRVPITKDPELFNKAVQLGHRLIHLNTFGERFSSTVNKAAGVPQGLARCTKPISPSEEAYPEQFSYDEASQILRVGDGEINPVSQAVWEFNVSGLRVIDSWLSYRMKEGAGRRSSVLEEIRPTRWAAQFTEELLELIWVLEATVALHPELDRLLEEIVASAILDSAELPKPTDNELKPPPAPGAATQASLAL